MRTIFAILGLLVGIGASAQSITLKEAISLAEKQNLSLKAADENLESARRSRNTSWNRFIPTVSAGIGLARTNEAPSAITIIEPSGTPTDSTYPDMTYIEYTPDHNWMLSASLTANWTFTLALFDGVKHTMLEYEKGLINRDKAKRELRGNVQKIFYGLLATQKAIELIDQRIETTTKRVEFTKANYEAGLASEFDYLSAQVGLNGLHPMKGNFEKQYQTSLLFFQQLLGEEQTRIPQGKIPSIAVSIDEEMLLNNLLDNHPDLLGFQKEKDILANTRRGLFTQLYTPTINVQYTMDPTFNPLKDPFTDSLFDDMDTDWSQQQGMLMITVGMPLDSLLPFTKDPVQLRNLKSSESAMIYEIQNLREMLIQQFRGNILSLQTARDTLKTRLLQEQVAQKAFQLASTGYKSGAQSLIELENSENNLNQASLDVLMQRIEIINTLVDLEYSTGIQLLGQEM